MYEEQAEDHMNTICDEHCEDSSSTELSRNDYIYESFDAPVKNGLDYVEFDKKFEIDPINLTIGQLLGSGNFSIVRSGMLSLSNGKIPVAVKMPKADMDSLQSQQSVESYKILERQRKLLRDELAIMAHLQAFAGGHDNVLKLFGAITTIKSDFCLITEYCEWGSLDIFLRKKFNNGVFYDELIAYESGSNEKQLWKAQRDSTENLQLRRENGQITTSDLLWFALQIARAMQFLCDKKVSYAIILTADLLANITILHRDVALRNVLLKPDYTLKVADFGLSRKLKDGEESYHMWKNSVALPIRYFAPESLADGQFTIRSECWSFGVVVWEIFTFAMEQPYSSEFANSGYNEVFFDFLIGHLTSGRRLQISEVVPKNLRTLLLQLWHKDPTERPSFRICRKVLRQELQRSCPQILLNEQTTAFKGSELSMFPFEHSIFKNGRLECRQRKTWWFRFWISVAVATALVVAMILSMDYVIHIISSQYRNGTNITSSPDESEIQNTPDIERCLECMCIHASNCENVDCEDDGKQVCGYFHLTFDQYLDCGKPDHQGTDKKMSFKRCAADKECSKKCVKAYATRFKKYHCRKLDECEQIARIHYGGPLGCHGAAADDYWNILKRCVNTEPIGTELGFS